jgi:Na+-driven multidrug efflux pump
VVYVPFAFIGSQLFDLQGIFVAAVLANIIVAAVAFIWFTRVIKTKILQVRVE